MSSDLALFRRLIDIGIALSVEKDTNKLMEIILLEAKDISNADGGTLYIRTKDDTLEFEIMHTDSLDVVQGGTSGVEITIPAVQMYLEDGSPNNQQIVASAALSGDTLNLRDAYDSTEFDFSGTKRFDEGNNYRTRSVLTVPLKDSQGDVIGVLQLLNAMTTDGQVIDFSKQIQPLIEALASQAAVALDNALLIESQENLLDAFITLMARAVDAKSPHTGGHCERVPELTKMLSQAACETASGPFTDFNLTDAQWYELHIGAWLHDCGKVTTPDYVVDKATKLETITDRIHEVRMRFEVLKLERTVAYQAKLIAGVGEPEFLKTELEKALAQIDDDYYFITECNLGGESMADDLVARVKKIAGTTWTRTLSDRPGVSFEELKRKKKQPEPLLPCQEPLLADRPDHLIEHNAVAHSADPDNIYGFKVEVPEYKYNLGEVYNLCISRGTLTNEERFKINDHIVQTIVMLDSLPFPKHLERVPEIAGGHHEKMDGTGYPKRLTGDEMSIPAKVMAIADVFEALTAADRPYKKPKKLSESINIMSFMVKDQHLDPELFRLFLESGVYRDYAQKYLLPAQIDEFDIASYLS